MLIQITDPNQEFPTPKLNFKVVHQFMFLDAETDDTYIEEEAKISRKQAIEIYQALQYALDHHMNVIVHCQAGLCRSGAVAEVGITMGFNDTGRYRQPNMRVKHYLFESYIEAGYNA